MEVTQWFILENTQKKKITKTLEKMVVFRTKVSVVDLIMIRRMVKQNKSLVSLIRKKKVVNKHGRW